MNGLANPLRGEAVVTLGKQSVTLAVTFGGLMRLSQAIGAKTMDEIYQRLLGFEPFAVSCAIRCLAVAESDDQRSDLSTRILSEQNISAADQKSWRDGIEQALTAHIEKGRAVRESVSVSEEVEAAVTGKKHQTAS
ncbi:hypothetical protein [Martelella mediterranea]|uniref:Tail tube GTA-gp10-like protein n=1 Tax=Martelella mediterranea TaxID=293089 RepID=A0A4R3NDL1_9HYPH|nr:hypothetical protein [Martelella mediterranea]TCT28859.1 hypothetical protein EDC90_10567 [Martelella mediterranea]